MTILFFSLSYTCAKSNDEYALCVYLFFFQLADFLTADFLTEQYAGQRDLAGKISTLERLMRQQGNFGEFLFDKTILA